MIDFPQHRRTVRFGPFELDLRTACLTRQGRQERLAVQPARVLALLVERRGELVTREELRSQLWPGDSFGDFDHGLNNAVNRLREALGDAAASPRYIQTAPRRGYRFIADVELAAPAPVLDTNPTSPTSRSLQGSSKLRARSQSADCRPGGLRTCVVARQPCIRRGRWPSPDSIPRPPVDRCKRTSKCLRRCFPELLCRSSHRSIDR